MATYGTMKTRIADEIARSDLSSQITAAILSAIRFYESERFWFNGTPATSTFSTVSAQEAYTSSTATFLATLVEDDVLTVTINSQPYPLRKVTYEEFRELSIGAIATADPQCYAIYGQRLFLYPCPNAVRTITVSYVNTITDPSSDTASNAWTTEAEELIRLHAKVDLFENVIREDAGYAEANRLRLREKEVLQTLRERSNLRREAGVVMAEYL